MKLIIPILCNISIVVLVYLLERHSSFRKVSYVVKQIVIGVLFGCIAAISSELGTPIHGAIINVRDAAPISAGLLFGAPAGVIAGVLGGLYRWFSVLWGAGVYTRLACTISTILAGVIAAALRKYMFDDKKPTWGYAMAITVVCEVVHMLMIFVTNMQDAVYAFDFVKQCSLPMIIGNAVAVGIATVVVTMLGHDRLHTVRKNEPIAQTFQRGLFICILVAFCATSIFTYNLQNAMSEIDTQSVLSLCLDDVYQDVTEASDENILELTKHIRTDFAIEHKYNIDVLPELAKKYDVSEINIVDEQGIIIGSTNEDFWGYDMASGEQSAEFLVLLNGEHSYVQKYQPMSYDHTRYRKYAGVSLVTGGLLQVGYDAERFRADINEHIINATKNRHVGTGGFVAICDENFCLITEDGYNGKPIEKLGLEIDTEYVEEKTVFEGVWLGVTYLISYTFAEGYYIIAAMPKEEAMFMRDASLYNSVFMQTLVFAILFVFIYFLIKRVIINNLRKINKSLSQITNGNLSVTVDVRSNAEFASLSDDINSTVSTLKQYIAEAAARIDKELEYAKDIQLSALPSQFPPYPEQDEFDIYAQMIAAKEVGGDFYDFYRLDDRKVAFLAADVSGKGIPAAMFMMTAKTILKDLAERGLAVCDIFTEANEKLCDNNESGMFVTAWMGILDLDTGVLQYANAGHNPPLILHDDGNFEYLKSRAGFVLAGMEGIRYRMGEMQLTAGDRMFLYTDGVTEATDVKNELYGEQRLSDYMNQHKTIAARELLHGLKQDIDDFVGEAPQFDDITMLLFDYKQGKAENAKVIEKIFPAEDAALNDVLVFVESELEKIECSMKNSMAIAVAIEEVFVNVAHYAYGGNVGNVKFGFGFEPDTRVATFVIADQGIPFNPLEKEDPDITLSAEERAIGGLGIFITKKTMDEISYRYENGENILTMKKTV